MSVPAAVACMVVLNQQREQTVQYHERWHKGTIAPCKAASNQRTIVENGKVVVQPIPVNATEPSANPSPGA